MVDPRVYRDPDFGVVGLLADRELLAVGVALVKPDPASRTPACAALRLGLALVIFGGTER